MSDKIFKLKRTTYGDTIRIKGKKIFISVYHLKYHEFEVKENPFVVYAAGTNPLAFVVSKWERGDLMIMNLALQWYIRREGYHDTVFSAEDPRFPTRMRIVI